MRSLSGCVPVVKRESRYAFCDFSYMRRIGTFAFMRKCIHVQILAHVFIYQHFGELVNFKSDNQLTCNQITFDVTSNMDEVIRLL